MKTCTQLLAVIASLLTFLYRAAPTQAEAQTNTERKIRVALFVDKGALARPELLAALNKAKDIEASAVSGEDVCDGSLNHYDVLFVPGGSDKREALSMERSGRDEVRRFVETGGLYIGVCAGYYLSTCTREQYLGPVPLHTMDSGHWHRGKATLDVELTPLEQQIFGVDKRNLSILYHNGPVIRYEGKNKDLAVTPLGYFRSERVAAGGEPGVMVGAMSMYLAHYGRGIVIGVSPHPEAAKGLHEMEINAIRFVYKEHQKKNRART